MTRKSGRFITFEGGEGAGKSTQISRLAARLGDAGFDVLLTREPGGVPGAEEVRRLLVEGEPGRWSANAETLLNYAARDAHLNGLIRPALASGKFVLCDRFTDSTRVYQGDAGGGDVALVEFIDRVITENTRPQLTFIFDIDPVVGLARAGRRETNGEDRYERQDLQYHERLRQGFLDVAERAPDRCAVLDASLPPDDVANAIWDIVSERLL